MNVLLITADQWRGDCLGASNHPLVRTPNLDRLAAQGVLFRNHYAGAAPCSPARACLYTGLYQMNNRVCGNGSPLDKRHLTLANAMRSRGYLPTLFGYTDQTADPRTIAALDPGTRSYEGILPGFEQRHGWQDDELPWLSWLKSIGYQDALDGVHEKLMHLPTSGVSDPPDGSPTRYRAEHTQTAHLTDEFIRWLQEQVILQPTSGWFAHISYIRPHPPFCVPEPFNSLFDPDEIAPFIDSVDAQQIEARHPYLAYQLGRNRKSSYVIAASGLVKDWQDRDFRMIAATYYGMLAEVDAQIGRVFDAVNECGYWNDTLIVFTSDHGEQMGDHRSLGKFGFYDQSYHIPLIIKTPGDKTEGRGVDAFTESVDVMPTILDEVGHPSVAVLDGKSLQPFLYNQPVSGWRREAHWEFDFRCITDQQAETALGISSRQANLSVLRCPEFKYVHFAGLPAILYDLTTDPAETNNLIEHADYQSVRVSMAEKLLQWRAEHLDQSLALTEVGQHGMVSAPV